MYLVSCGLNELFYSFKVLPDTLSGNTEDPRKKCCKTVGFSGLYLKRHGDSCIVVPRNIYSGFRLLTFELH